MTRRVQVVICGAGITGISAAYFLANSGVRDILLVDDRLPLTLTSDRSTECYRNWWPDPEMLALMSRSIDLMEQLAEETGNIFRLNRRGYLYLTGDERKIPAVISHAKQISQFGAGPLRSHSLTSSTYSMALPDGYRDAPDGADLLLGNDLIRNHYPYISKNAVAGLHVRRAGWLSAQQLGMCLLEIGKRSGVKLETAHISGVEKIGNRVSSIRLNNGEKIECSIFVNAAGPFLKSVGLMLGINIPVHTELHLKVAMRDHLGVVGREAPLLIWDDPQHLPLETSDRTELENDLDTRWMAQSFPPGVHTRPEGSGESQTILILWEYKTQIQDPIFPIPIDDQYPEIALRGLSTMIPGLNEYFKRIPRPQIDGGYYVKTRENRLLAGPLPVDGAYIIGAVSGYGIMSACAAGELLAAYILGTELPSYAPAFSFARYEDANYLKRLDNWGESGQL